MQNKKSYITLLNVLSAFAVVYLHVNNSCFGNFSYWSYWPTAVVIRAFFYYAVPIFLMLSGANLIDYRDRYTTKEYAVRRAKKILPPYLFFSLIALLIYIRFENPYFQISLSSILNGLVNSDFMGAYWFFMPLFLFYLAAPLFSAVERGKRVRICTYLVVAGFVVNIFIPFAISVFSLPIYNVPEFGPVAGYLIYPLLGYVIDNYDFKKAWRIAIYILGVAALILDIFGTIYTSWMTGVMSDLYYGYLNVPCFIYSSAVFLLFKQIGPRLMEMKLIVRLNDFMARYSFGIYLMHMYFVKSFETLAPYVGINSYSLSYRLIMPIVIINICIFLIWLLRKIPGVKHILP